MDSLEVPSFHPIGRKARKKKQQNNAQNGADSRSNLSDKSARSSPTPDATRDSFIGQSFTPQLKNRRHLFAATTPSLSVDNSRVTRPPPVQQLPQIPPDHAAHAQTMHNMPQEPGSSASIPSSNAGSIYLELTPC